MAKYVPSAFGELLKKYRLAARVTQEELAARSRLSARAISDLEGGRRLRPRRETVVLLADALRLSPTDRGLLEEACRSARSSDPPKSLASVPRTPKPGREGVAPASTIPLILTSFVGRESELIDVKRLLGTTRVLTLSGAGGCGKTRLAYRLASDVEPDYRDGVAVVQLATTTDPRFVPQTIASALGLREKPHEAILDTIIQHLRPAQVLLVVDNCEHLVDACAEAIAAILLACANVRIVTTSRDSLGIPGEVIWCVPPMATPSPELLAGSNAEILGQYDAVRLFLDRARSQLPAFRLHNDNAQTIASICGTLDGIPLAIELAAARVRILSVEHLEARLDDRFRLLVSRERHVLQRHQTLQALIDWSYDLLTPPERHLLRQLSVFVGGWVLEAAEALGEWTSLESKGCVLDLLGQLVSKSLVISEEQHGAMRYHLLETIRQYARERLSREGEEEEACHAHASYFLALTNTLVPRLAITDQHVQKVTIDHLQQEHNNLRAALRWSLKHEPITAARLASAMARFWRQCGYCTEGRAWLEAGLNGFAANTELDRVTRSQIFQGISWIAADQGDFASVGQCLAEARELLRGLDAEPDVPRLIEELSVQEALWLDADLKRSRRILEERLISARENGDERGAAWTIVNLGDLDGAEGAFDLARGAFKEGLGIFRSLRDYWSLGNVLMRLGWLSLHERDFDHARLYLTEAENLAREIGNKLGLATIFLSQARQHLDEGDLGRADLRIFDSIQLFRELGDRSPHSAVSLLGELAINRERYDYGVWLTAVAFIARQRANVPVTRTLLHGLLERGRDAALARARTALGGRAFDLAWESGRTREPNRVMADLLATLLSTTPSLDPQGMLLRWGESIG